MKKSEILDSVEFAVIKEYFEVGGNVNGIATVTGLSRKIINDIKEAPYYKDYLDNLKKIHRQKISKSKQSMVDSEEIIKLLTNLAESIDKMAKHWEVLEPKLDQILETRKPWLGRVPRF